MARVSREALALAELKRSGFEVYAPRIVERRFLRRRVVEATPLLFPSYIFVGITAQWHGARWSPGIRSLIMNGSGPARVADDVIGELRGREVDGLIELPPRFLPGDRVRVERGPFAGLAGLYAGQAPSERVLILLSLLGAARRVALPAADVKRLRSA